jgi:hypothetical protein
MAAIEGPGRWRALLAIINRFERRDIAPPLGVSSLGAGSGLALTPFTTSSEQIVARQDLTAVPHISDS